MQEKLKDRMWLLAVACGVLFGSLVTHIGMEWFDTLHRVERLEYQTKELLPFVEHEKNNLIIRESPIEIPIK